MHLTIRTLVPAVAFAVAISAAPALAQQPEPAAPTPVQDAQQALTAEGELLRVDAEAKKFWVRSSDADRELQFQFNDETEITGAGQSEEGLATMTGTMVKVEYRAEGETAVATRIDIQARALEPEAPLAPQPQQ